MEARLGSFLRSMPEQEQKSKVLRLQHMMAQVVPNLFNPEEQETELRETLTQLEKEVDKSNQQNKETRCGSFKVNVYGSWLSKGFG